MAVRWGPGEETFTTCNMDIFPLETLDETTGLCSENTLGSLQDCLEPTILSLFEDTPAIKTRDLEEETTLLTALTEILDNVDDENLSPFDMLPESELLSGQKGREQSPLRRTFCLSRSPTGKIRSTGKTLPMVQQRSDGEEDDDSLTLSPASLTLSSNNDLLDWDTLPILLGEEHGEDGLSVNLGDLVKHMHPYCMAISLEDEQGDQMLPEGGILLEVIDQGENGEPILAIPEMEHPISVKLDELMSDSNVLEENNDQASDTSEHIVVDDDDDVDVNVKPPVGDEGKITRLDVRSKIISDSNNKKVDLKGSNNFSQKTEAACPPPTTGGRVLRSASLKKVSHKKRKKSEKKLLKEDRNALQDCDTMSTSSSFTKPENITISQTEGVTIPALPVLSKRAEGNQSEAPPKVECLHQSDSVSSVTAPASVNEESAVAASTDEPCHSVNHAAAPEINTTESVCEPCPLVPPVVIAEPKPKSLSLAEYRRLRQQKKPAPIQKLDDSSTKWPSLPELPRELPPLPHLPDPSLRDPRRSRPPSKETEEVKPAWMPRGPCAPPTPEALLAPPAYMVASTPAAPKYKPAVSQTVPPQHSKSENISAAPHKQGTTTGEERSATDNPLTPPASVTVSADALKPAANVVTSKPCNAAVTLEMKTSLTTCQDPPKSTDSCEHKSSFSKLPNHKTPEESERSPVKSSTEDVIEAFTSEMGIEATDLTSLLEQFEETQAKEEQCVPEVCGRAVAVGNSSSDLNSERNCVERKRANDLSSTALTPPATPPHPTWRPLVPVSLLGKSKSAEAKSGPSKTIEIEAQPLPPIKAQSKYTPAPVAPDMACQDHDYCLPNKGTSSGEAGKRWNVKQNSSIMIKPIKQPITPALHNVQNSTVRSAPSAPKTQRLDLQSDLESSSVFETPDASPTRDADINNCPKQAHVGRGGRQRAPSHSPSPKRRPVGRSRGRRSRRSPSPRSNSSESDSSRSRSYSPPKKRYRPHRSRSSSFSRSHSRSSSPSQSRSRSPRCRRYSYSSSRSASWSRSRSYSRSQSRSRSRSPQWSRKRLMCSPSRDLYGTNVKANHELKRRKEKAIEERRVVYVGRIRGTMTQKELRERFSYFGEIEECTLHFRDHGDNYGFVTYYNTNDAFMAIENGSKLRKPDEYPFDLCFGGRRQFCQTSYADLDSSKDYEPLPSRNKTLALDFDTLLKQAQQNMKR